LRFARAGLSMSRRSVIGLAAVLSFLAVAVELAIGVKAATTAVLFPLAVGWLLLNAVAKRNHRRFLEALPGYLDNVRQLVIVGNSLQQAMERAAEDGNEALLRYLRPMRLRLQSGASLTESLTVLADRFDIVELHTLAAAVQTNLRFGGKMSELLAGLIRFFRDRRRIERELRGATAETRATIWVLASLPALIALDLFFTNQNYREFYLFSQPGHHLLALITGVEAAGILVMRRIARVDF
jgi:tight adherence protein B